MGNTYGGVAPANTVRKVRARPAPAVGALHKGNRYTVSTAPGVVCAADMPAAWHGDLPAAPPQWLRDLAAEKVITAGYSRKRGNVVCPGCGILTPCTGVCAQCWA